MLFKDVFVRAPKKCVLIHFIEVLGGVDQWDVVQMSAVEGKLNVDPDCEVDVTLQMKREGEVPPRENRPCLT